jgi:hypothetical protein
VAPFLECASSLGVRVRVRVYDEQLPRVICARFRGSGQKSLQISSAGRMEDLTHMALRLVYWYNQAT